MYPKTLMLNYIPRGRVLETSVLLSDIPEHSLAASSMAVAVRSL